MTQWRKRRSSQKFLMIFRNKSKNKGIFLIKVVMIRETQMELMFLKDIFQESKEKEEDKYF
jgi:hypothetical protein